MQLEAQKYLFDIQQAADRISRFCEGKKFEDYRIVWGVVEGDLPVLRASLTELLPRF
jgi:uncharacterized protein with HEPN domain